MVDICQSSNVTNTHFREWALTHQRDRGINETPLAFGSRDGRTAFFYCDFAGSHGDTTYFAGRMTT
jgi:hypothetical protein